MRVRVKTHFRSVAELGDSSWPNQFADPYKLIERSAWRVRTFQRNPYLKDTRHPAQMIGVVDGKAMGYIGPFPLHMFADGRIYEAEAGDDLFVHPDYRKSGYALDIMETLNNLSCDHLSINTGLSDMAQRLCQLLGQTNFTVLKFAYIKRCGHLFDAVLPKAARMVICPCLNVAFWCHRQLLGVLLSFKVRGLLMKEISSEDDASLSAASELIRADSRRFRQDIDERWLKWVLENDFSDDPKMVKKMYGIYRKGTMIGFALVRTSIRSGRCRILEWQFDKASSTKEPWLLIWIARQLIRSANFVAIAVGAEDKPVVGVLSKLLPQTKRQMVSIGLGENSPLQKHQGYDDPRNWRLRPGMGDSCFYG